MLLARTVRANPEELSMTKTTDTAALIERARRACEDVASVQKDIKQALAETRHILATARPEVVYAPAAREPSIATEDMIDLMMATAVQQMLTILRAFPLDWQSKIVKVLVVRTVVMETAPMPTPTITPTA
jgi:hypothetical protein